MKKNTALFKIIIASLALSHNLAFSEDSAPAEEQESNESTVPQRSTEYVIPQPQLARIEALKGSLISKGLTHQVVELEANGTTFLTLHREASTSETQGCVVLLHSDNQHPNWPDAIAPLRNALPQHGWCTLSIEIPDIINRMSITEIPSSATAEEGVDSEALPNEEDVFSRINAVIEKTKEDNAEQLILLGHKTGAAYALKYLAQEPTSAAGAVFIDMEVPSGVAQYDLAQYIKQLPLPALDYYLESQNRHPRFIAWRKQASNQREEVQGEYILFSAIPDNGIGDDRTQKLIQRVRGFLKQNTDQIDQRKNLPEFKKGLFYNSPVGS
ncbi:alpha/beta hydrolase family protein [Marinomonas sp. C2222]|uniref:Alpha/beta hydrolase family protein n=1 Tax=Marinomonas sargassi TaxID=2984494 RepID=A0ABT2YNQ8_9GAMM|nr:alpha/beta hydrolase family protein [Marinomonas sargassi]MCV2401526.1 alpha/beta hydrolase family protein [Marinomonas sargassi]